MSNTLLRTTTDPDNPATRRAVEALYERGAHFVLCGGRDGKMPLWAAWQRRKPGLDAVSRHDRLGVVPWSLGATALDVDLGDVAELVHATGWPLVTLESPRGHHLYFEDCQPRGNGAFRVAGCVGDVRGARGYLRLYPGGAERLESALATTPAGSSSFPADLFSSAGVPAPRSLPVEGPRAFNVRAPADLPELREVREGDRHAALFDHLRYWAYVQLKGTDLDAWIARCQRIATDLHELIPVYRGQSEYPLNEALESAYGVATWTWAGGGPLDHSREAQARRGRKSGRVRRGVQRGRVVNRPEIAGRDARIVAMVEAGATIRETAKAFGLSGRAVHHVIGRDVPLFRAAQLTLEGDRRAIRDAALVGAYLRGASASSLARAFSISRSAVRKILVRDLPPDR